MLDLIAARLSISFLWFEIMVHQVRLALKSNICSEVSTIIIVHVTMIGNRKFFVKGTTYCVKQWVFMIALKRLSIQSISFIDTSPLTLLMASLLKLSVYFRACANFFHIFISSMFSVHGLVAVWSILKMKFYLLSDHFPWTT